MAEAERPRTANNIPAMQATTLPAKCSKVETAEAEQPQPVKKKSEYRDFLRAKLLGTAAAADTTPQERMREAAAAWKEMVASRPRP